MSYCNNVGIHKNQGLFDAVLTDYLWQQQEMPSVNGRAIMLDMNQLLANLYFQNQFLSQNPGLK